MENLNHGSPYTFRPSNPAGFAPNTGFPSAHCHKCCHSSALVAALWERISELESRIHQISAEKHGVETVVRSILRLETTSIEPHHRNYSKDVHGSGEPGNKTTSGTESFQSSDTLVELSPIAENSATEGLNVIDQPLIDLSGPHETDNLFGYPTDVPNGFKIQPHVSSEHDPANEHSYKYIHHFQTRTPHSQEESSTSCQPMVKSINEAQKPHITLSIPTPAATQPVYSSSDEADSEGTCDPSVHISASTSFSESFSEHDAPKCFTVNAISDAMTEEQLKCNPGDRTSSRAICSGLKDSFLANPRESSNVNNGLTRAIKMASCTNYPKTPHPSGRSLSQGVEYKPGVTARDLYRKVVISGLTASCSLCRVLEQVRGGLVVEAVLVNTISITGTKSVVISFFEERSAMAYADYVNDHLCKIDGQEVIASLVLTPSWPLSLALKRAIREQHHTRSLEIQDFPRDISSSMLRSDLEDDSTIKLDSIEHMEMASNGTATLRFCSVRAAQQAFGTLSSRLKYGRCRLRYAVDPCTLPFSHVR